MRRRAFIESGVLAASVLASPRFANSQGAREGPATVTIRDGLSLIRGRVNGAVYKGAEATVLIDVPAPEFDGAAELYGSEPILINTNWREEHTAANDSLGRMGATIIAHENTRLWMGNDFTVRWESRRYKPRAAEALPNSVFFEAKSLELGDETVELRHVPRAHTDGDIYVRFVRANVIIAGDLLTVSGYPVLDFVTGGWIRGMSRATEHLLEIADDETLVVPAVGVPQRRDALEAQLEPLPTHVRGRGIRLPIRDESRGVVQTDPLAAYRESRGDPTFFLEDSPTGVPGATSVD